MKLAIGTALFVLLAGTSAYAQDQEKEKPAPKEEKKQEPAAKEHPQAQEKHEQHDKAQEQPKAQEQQKAQQHQAQEQQKNQSKQVEKEKSDAAKQQQGAKQQQVARQQQQQQVAHQDHAQNQQAQRDGGNRNARRISEQDFHSHFGREHSFRVTRSEDRRFNYGGYYWVYNDPWPSGWAYTDDVYVDEIDGEYYLIDPVHPGVRLMIVIGD
jgi:outer membrane biosynthesis protein TonB